MSTPPYPPLRFLIVAFLALLASAARADLADTIRQVKPSVVVVGTFDKLRSPQFVLRGTGFVVGEGRLIATNHHVVKFDTPPGEGERLAILVRDGKEATVREATLARSNAEHDLAILRVQAPLPPLTLAADGEAQEGQQVAFMGFPIGEMLGYSPVTHRGIISSITPIANPGGNERYLTAKSISRLRSGAFDIYQLDATAYPGNSGGPLFDIDSGKVIGVINMVLVKGTKEAALTKPSGISYAIPAKYLAALLKDAEK